MEPNQTMVTLTTQILNDDIVEEIESFTVQLKAGKNLRIEEGLATIQIVDDDGKRIM